MRSAFSSQVSSRSLLPEHCIRSKWSSATDSSIKLFSGPFITQSSSAALLTLPFLRPVILPCTATLFSPQPLDIYRVLVKWTKLPSAVPGHHCFKTTIYTHSNWYAVSFPCLQPLIFLLRLLWFWHLPAPLETLFFALQFYLRDYCIQLLKKREARFRQNWNSRKHQTSTTRAAESEMNKHSRKPHTFFTFYVTFFVLILESHFFGLHADHCHPFSPHHRIVFHDKGTWGECIVEERQLFSHHPSTTKHSRNLNISFTLPLLVFIPAFLLQHETNEEPLL